MSKNDSVVLRISLGKHRGKVENKEMSWGRFSTRFDKPFRDTTGTYEQYMALSPDGLV
jgi:hypothetical protein